MKTRCESCNSNNPDEKTDMKHPATLTTLGVLTLGTCLFAQVQRPDSYEPNPSDYDGPWDDTYWTDVWLYEHLHLDTTLGMLAFFSDVIGVGQVVNKETTRFTVIVDHAIVGCTNGASIVVYDGREVDGGRDSGGTRDDYLPSNNSRIVFAVYTNDYNLRPWRLYWDS